MTRGFLEHQVPALVHGRYLVAGDEPPEPGRPLLVGFHGYGENAERLLENLRKIPGSEDWTVCSISALNRFYNPRTRDVIGCWMTGQGREQAIEDNARYVGSVITRLRRELQPSDHLVLAGFSQGVAMAYRAAARSGFRPDGLLILAGDVPPEIGDDETAHLPPVLLGRGTRDELYTPEQMEKDLAVLERRGVEVTSCVFEDGHVWAEDYLEAAGKFLERVRNGSSG